MADTIFLIYTEEWAGEDSSGRDYYEFRYDPDTAPGFFLTREDARAWIDKRLAEGERKYAEALRAYDRKVETYNEQKRKRDKAYALMCETAREAGISTPIMGYLPVPVKPSRSRFVGAYEINEISREED